MFTFIVKSDVAKGGYLEITNRCGERCGEHVPANDYLPTVGVWQTKAKLTSEI